MYSSHITRSRSYALASRSQVVFWWLRHLLIAFYFHFIYRPRPFFIPNNDNNPGGLFGLRAMRRRGLWGNILVFGAYAVLLWAIVRAQRRLGDASLSPQT